MPHLTIVVPVIKPSDIFFPVEGVSLHRGVLVFWADQDPRVLEAVDAIRDALAGIIGLMAIAYNKGSVQLIWEQGVPRGFTENDMLQIRGDNWSIIRSDSVYDLRR